MSAEIHDNVLASRHIEQYHNYNYSKTNMHAAAALFPCLVLWLFSYEPMEGKTKELLDWVWDIFENNKSIKNPRNSNFQVPMNL